MVVLPRETFKDLFITARAENGETVEALFRKTADAIRNVQARIISMEVFGVSGANELLLRKAFGAIDWPVTWLEEGCEQANPLQGVQVWAVAGLAVEPLRIDGRVLGSQFEIDGVQYCRLGGIVPSDVSQPRYEQAYSVFESMEGALRACGMDFSNVVRTWFYNYEMLDWYDEFNQVRTTFFKEHRVFDKLVPASTGIGGRNAAGAALTAGLLAAKGASDDSRGIPIPSPLQCPALDYGSSFSRAVEFEIAGYRRLSISGSASIAPGGESAHIGNVDDQVVLAMQVVKAILESRAMGWSDVTRAIAYFKHRKDVPAFERWCAAHGLNDMPVLLTNNDICRDDLLFEIEADAAVCLSK
jgi:enamine deaminase RidA (YjgF/YER057c/UK114 family)